MARGSPEGRESRCREIAQLHRIGGAGYTERRSNRRRYPLFWRTTVICTSQLHRQGFKRSPAARSEPNKLFPAFQLVALRPMSAQIRRFPGFAGLRLAASVRHRRATRYRRCQVAVELGGVCRVWQLKCLSAAAVVVVVVVAKCVQAGAVVGAATAWQRGQWQTVVAPGGCCTCWHGPHHPQAARLGSDCDARALLRLRMMASPTSATAAEMRTTKRNDRETGSR